MKNRREFFKLSAVGSLALFALGTKVTNANLSANGKDFNLGLQLYTVRDAMSTDPKGTLKRIAELGYQNIELVGYADGKFYGFTPAEFKKIVDDVGLRVISSHTMIGDPGTSVDNAQKMAEEHALLGAKYCIQPWVMEEDRTIEKYRKMVDDLNRVGEITKQVGVQFGYHNHNFEFTQADGIVPYFDLLLKELDPELVTMEIDLFWVTKAGLDPVEMFEKYPGRFQLFHMKDMHKLEPPFYEANQEDICSVGEGVIDFKRILKASKIAGMKYMFVEDDSQGNGNPFQSIDVSIDNLTSKILK